MQRFPFDSSCPELDKLTGARVIRNIDRHHSRNFISSGHIQCCDEKKTFFLFLFQCKKESLLPPKVTSVMNGKAFISGEDSDAIGLLVLMMLTSESRTGPACQPGWWMALFFSFFFFCHTIASHGFGHCFARLCKIYIHAWYLGVCISVALFQSQGSCIFIGAKGQVVSFQANLSLPYWPEYGTALIIRLTPLFQDSIWKRTFWTPN